MSNKEQSLEQLRHKNRMAEIEAEKLAKIEVEKVRFDYACQLQRIKNADIKRTIAKRENKNFAENYWKK
jgi:hypothetical protein